MDTKLKRSRVVSYVIIKLFVLGALFISVSLYIVGALNGYLTSSYMDTKLFGYTAHMLISNVYDLASNNEYYNYDNYDAQTQEHFNSILEENNGTFFYYVKKTDEQTVYQNSDCNSLEEFKNKYFNSPELYGMAIVFSDGKATAVKNGHTFNDDEWKLRYNLFGSYGGVDIGRDTEMGIAFASQSELQKLKGYGYGSVYECWNDYDNGKHQMQMLPPIILGLSAAVIIMAAFSKYRTYMRSRIGAILIKVWIEIKIITLLGIALIVFSLLEWQYMFMYRMPFDTVHAFYMAIVLFWAYFQLCDLLSNGLDIFKVNIITTLLKIGRSLYRSINGRHQEHGFRRIMQERLLVIVKTGVACAAIVICLIAVGVLTSSVDFVVLSVIIAFIGLMIMFSMSVRFAKDYTQVVKDIDTIMEHIELMSAGDINRQLKLPGENLLQPLANNINVLQKNMKASLEEKIKSERMKVELITNVSHDLKTPLTSIINYTDLLLEQKLSPDCANEYVAIINKKAMRLNAMVLDLFDVAKANSGNIDINMQRLNLSEHIHQCMAEMDEQIAACSNEIRLSLPDEPVYIMADGQKLYRVFENLLMNAIKYSLKNTRIYIMVHKRDDEAIFTIKNVSSYEMDFSGDDIVRRFVRGDPSRTTEGSGLGLAIAKSFVEVQNGKFSVDIDGDIFRITIQFKIAQEDKKTTEPAVLPEVNSDEAVAEDNRQTN